jgi:hypothetical protein
MYLLPESSAAAREWESKFNYVASIFDEVRGWSNTQDSDASEFSSNYSDSEIDSFGEDDYLEEDNNKMYVPLKLMW